jgi:hypothetical protein
LERFERELLADGAGGGGERYGSRFLEGGTTGRMDVAEGPAMSKSPLQSPKLFSLSLRNGSKGECNLN